MQEKSLPVFSERLRRSMLQAGVTQARLAHDSKVSKGYISQLLSGNKDCPSEEVLKKLAEVLGISSEWLLGYGPLYDPALGEKARVMKSKELLDRAQQYRDFASRLEMDRQELIELADFYEHWAQSLSEVGGGLD
jgi:transcriptional regulator with XRE-family HTH domain